MAAHKPHLKSDLPKNWVSATAASCCLVKIAKNAVEVVHQQYCWSLGSDYPVLICNGFDVTKKWINKEKEGRYILIGIAKARDSFHDHFLK